ncbi:MAG TPA: hypothetical protein PKL97_06730 [Candidatus Omnitrophota bacterium]|nr:hypothetical protein [Candidatus Omnitrophota bacterium]
MSLRRDTVEEIEKIWSVILNPVTGEMAKDRAVRILSEVFSFSDEESRELVQNAPVILFEDLPREQAQRVIDCLHRKGLELLMTDSLLQKRKCFRAVWFEGPRFNFLEEETLIPEIKLREEDHKVLDPGEAIAHIREELNGNGASIRRESRAEGAMDFKRKYEMLLREHNLLGEERLIQDRKIETLEKEVRLLREKENCFVADLKIVQTEKETLRQELDALDVRNELLTKQIHEHQQTLTRFSALETSEKVLKERLDSLLAEYADTEKSWASKLSQAEHEKKQLEQDCENLRASVKDLHLKLGEAERRQEELVSREALTWCERALKDLVRRQEELEGDIRDREKLLKGILSEQEKLEQEILRFRKFRNSA